VASRLRHRHLLRARLGRSRRFPGIVLDAHGPRVNGYLFLSDRLAAHWPMLDDFEEGYDRVPVEVTTDDGQQISAWIYQLQPRGNPHSANLRVEPSEECDASVPR
jgi:gamma-glutamylcyclotransferase (GGCT)/AIG2-like uncharacterized protein YtfP